MTIIDISKLCVTEPTPQRRSSCSLHKPVMHVDAPESSNVGETPSPPETAIDHPPKYPDPAHLLDKHHLPVRQFIDVRYPPTVPPTHAFISTFLLLF